MKTLVCLRQPGEPAGGSQNEMILGESCNVDNAANHEGIVLL